MTTYTRGLTTGVALASLAAILSSTAPASAETDAAKMRLQQYVQAIDKIPADKQKMLSGSTLSMYEFAKSQTTKTVNGITNDVPVKKFGASASTLLQAPLARQAPIAAITLAPGVVHVNDPSRDFVYSQVSGFTQSETSTARCGNTVVVGFNDSGSLSRTLIDPNKGLSFNGVSFSSDGGATFNQLQYLNPGNNTANFLLGDPVVACSSPTLFYYSSIFSTTRPSPNPMGSPTPLSAISISGGPGESLPGAAPRIAVAKNGFFHTLDKDWMTLDPTTPSTIYITYTDFDGSLTGSCGTGFRYAIELVRSTDSGLHWSAPTTVTEECSGASGSEVDFAQGSQVAVDKAHKVYVAYEAFIADGTREIRIQGSTDQGMTFNSPVTVSALTPVGDGSVLKGGLRTNEFPSLAIDPATNNLFIVWADAKDNTIADMGAAQGFYGYGNIFGSRSSDGGMSWSPALAAHAVAHHDQFMPGIAVDHVGNIAVCYYDRRNDPNDVRIDRYCTSSNTVGVQFSDLKATATSYLPEHDTDNYIASRYMGDYDTTASDTLGIYPGFVGGFEIIQGINPNVYAFKFLATQ